MQIKENTSIHPGKISLGVGRYVVLFGGVCLCYCLAVFLCATVWWCFSALLFGDVSLWYCLVMFLCATVW